MPGPVRSCGENLASTYLTRADLDPRRTSPSAGEDSSGLVDNGNVAVDIAIPIRIACLYPPATPVRAMWPATCVSSGETDAATSLRTYVS